MTFLLSSGLLAASLVVGQAGEPPLATKQPPLGSIVQSAPGTQPSRPILGWFSRDDRPVLGRIQSWWKREPKDAAPNNFTGKDDFKPVPAAPVSRPKETAPTTDFPRKLPNPQSQGVKPAPTIAKEAAPGKLDLEQTTLQNITPPKTTKYPILSQHVNKIGRDEKFEWITGQLEIENGNHVLYYGTPETVDKYNGRIILQAQQSELNQFKKGDLISVRGQVTQRQTMQGAVPLYRISHAALIERPKS